MNDVSRTIDATLIGGPADFPPEFRNQQVAAGAGKVKVAFYGGYEHFENRDSETPEILVWVGRTRVAE
ncbi:hypothetical protein ACWT_5915 [Actinoplanes sp. SE50]|uniref:DUF5988 family protein n=1 Tax=unclassified Actinoplanes TaxID=2626549 RepID=UPI00023EBFA8|nr:MULTISPECIES: DUF5988 family protein [unclassified Actinoplanes]AEV86934.1 hypothetical protein ACPL_6047 [Actinoplanes sp. SE50/110]ATO85330.1 hypothetical protein ACWT_5915 [Actinoplanes sp. SE50]SLM02741.1 hypothetical protein ACSP50_6026 [Actinoplanes sp. SE50/110]